MDQENLYLKIRPNLDAFLRPKERQSMPDLSRFYGIYVYLNWQDHNPPHLHFSYQGEDYSITIKDRIIKGDPPHKIVERINKWMDEREDQIEIAWDNAQKGFPFEKIKPLK